jgi:hypothetical protein
VRTLSGNDHVVTVNGGTSGAVGVIVRVRMNAFSISGDTSVSIMD